MALLGFDVGSSSVKASLVEESTGKCLSSARFPGNEAPITSLRQGWAEQDPLDWWQYLKTATAKVLEGAGNVKISAIGISYQMHGLVCVDKDLNPLRRAIIWCDSRAVPYGDRALRELGTDWCLGHMLNSPGNFTAAKLAWVKENEPGIYGKIHKIMLPGDFIAAKLTGEVCTTIGGLSEGIMWDFTEKSPAKSLMDYYGFDSSILPRVTTAFSDQGCVCRKAAAELGIAEGIPITYRAGDQPNNALSLGVLSPGEIASTAGTSGVIYGVSDKVAYDAGSRVNTFAHVNYSPNRPRLGILLCINGTGILNSWIKNNMVPEGMSYDQMNSIAAGIPIGSDGVHILPFGNGVERMLGNRNPCGCKVSGLDFNRHSWKNVVRAAQEGIVFSFKYGIDIMKGMGMKVGKIHAGNANMFLSPVFRETLAGVTGASIELYDTDGSAGAAKGAGIGAGIYKTADEAFSTLERLSVTEPSNVDIYADAYDSWLNSLKVEL